MKFTKEQKNTAYKKLSPEVQDFIMSNETTELIASYLKDINLSEEQIDLADSEILYAMFGLQTISDAINNIAKLSNKNVNDISRLKANLENNIFRKIKMEEGETKQNWFNLLSEENKNEIKNVLKSSLKNNDFQKTLGGISQYLKNAPQKMQKAISDSVWPKRVGEIALKYSLTEEQTTILQNLVLFVIIGVEEPETFAYSVEKELGISKLLAEQIVADADVRVFQYVFNLISENAENKTGSVAETAWAEVSKVPFGGSELPRGTLDTNTEIPEMRPEILPAVEKGEGVRVNPPPIVQDAQKEPDRSSFKQTPAPDNLPGVEMPPGKPANVSQASPAPQKPVAPVVPKLQTEVEYPPKYVVDPYREPID